MTHSIRTTLAAVFAVTFLMTSAEAAVIYTGGLSSAAGITGQGQWSENLTFAWTVDDTTNPGFWTYQYTFSDLDPQVNQRRVVDRVLIEVSAAFSLAADFLGFSGGANVSLDTWDEDSFDPDSEFIPSAFRALMFDTLSTTATSYSFSFHSPRAPVWGDVYMTDNGTRARNAGFGDPDADPANPPSSGSVDFHALVPDTGTRTQQLPEPGSLLLFGTASLLGGRSWRRRRR